MMETVMLWIGLALIIGGAASGAFIQVFYSRFSVPSAATMLAGFLLAIVATLS